MNLDKTTESEEPAASQEVSQLIGIGLLTRLFMDTGIQIFFPFLPTIAQGLNVSTITMGRMVSLRSSMGLLSPVFGTLADKKGYRLIMRIGLLLGAIGYTIIGLSHNLWQLAPGMVFAGVGTFAFAPTFQAYLSMKLPFHRRARGMGILEYAWALSGIIGLYLVGLLIEATSWRAPMFIVSAALFLAAILYGFLPATEAKREEQSQTIRKPRFSWQQVRQFLQLGKNGRSAWSTIIMQGLIMFSAMHLFINYGSWLAAEYEYTPAALGRVALLLGIADLAGSVIVSIITDRLGKKRSTFLGSSMAMVGFAILPLLNQSIVFVLIGLVIVRFAFEFSVVSNMVLITVQSATARGKLLTLSAASALLGSTIAGFTGPLAYANLGPLGLGIIPAITMLIAVCLLYFFVTE
ncbi:MAG: MFS transporter [Chloroflexi bacterium]|nr:MFS transporter [Chloroflexota bacterium]